MQIRPNGHVGDLERGQSPLGFYERVICSKQMFNALGYGPAHFLPFNFLVKLEGAFA